VEGLNTNGVYEYAEKFGVISYRNKDYLLTVNRYSSQSTDR
jgi:hypothetical protein